MPRKKRQYHHGDLRRALLDASLAIIAESGVEALSLREAARRAGVSPGAPYHHFQSKSELLGAIAGHGFTELTRRSEEALAQVPASGDARTSLAALGRAYVGFALDRPTEFRLMFRPTLVTKADLPADCDARGPFDLLARTVHRLFDELALPHIERDHFVIFAWSLVHGVSELALEGPLAETPLAGKQAGEAVVEVLLQLLKLQQAKNPTAPTPARGKIKA